jgi:hypothetical protein
MKRTFTLIALLGILLPMFAYHSEVVFKSPHGERFILNIDGYRQNQQPRVRVRVMDLAPGTHRISAQIFRDGFGPAILAHWDRVLIRENARSVFHIIPQGHRAYTLELVNVESLLPPPPPPPLYSDRDYDRNFDRGHSQYERVCASPMHPSVFNNAVQQVRRVRNPRDQFRVAKDIVRDQCPSSRQVRKLMQVLGQENAKLMLAKYAWAHVWDAENYQVVFDELDRESSAMALNDYINAHPRREAPRRPGYSQGRDWDRGYDRDYDYDDDYYDNRFDDREDRDRDYRDRDFDNRDFDNRDYRDRDFDRQPVPPRTYPMSKDNFRDALRTVKQQNTDTGKLRVAKQVAQNNLLSSRQVRQMMEAMSFDRNRLDLAKFAYQYVHDPENYHRVKEAFAFSASDRALDRFIEDR